MNYLLNISPIVASMLVVLLPFLAFLMQALLGKKFTSGIFSLVAIVLSTILSGLFVFAEVWNATPLQADYSWFTIGEKTFCFGILLNNLTVLMQFIVCIIALPVHIYSKSYMKGDAGIHRYWMYLSLFCFAMLGLTISKNLLMMYIFWELVGFASYLLIGFWFTKESAVQANKKAFLINRIGDLGFLIGLAILFSTFGTLDLVEILGKDGLLFQEVIDHNSGLITGAGICFFLGAMAKSAQFPLHLWLPDAMEGPTSVSSLIHAATMVAAGVFLLSSIFPLFNCTVLLIIAIIGTITAITAAIFALGQYDIKKILAFSTISQLGYMMVAVSIGAWDAGMFHLATHAFFKCLLFLSAGAVIHEMAHLKAHTHQDFDPQDLRNMGGLRQYMPKTFLLMSLASLALAGFPLTSGFLSKDAIVISAFEWALQQGDLYLVVPIILVLVSILTAFYIGRLIFKAFFGTLRVNADHAHLHDAPKTMLIPMAFLGICSLFIIFSWNPFSYANAAILNVLVVNYTFPEIHFLHTIVPVTLTASALLSWWIGYNWYVKGKYPLNASSSWIHLAQNQFGMNEWMMKTFVSPTVKLGKISFWFDKYIVDGLVNGASYLIKQLSGLITWIDKYIVDGIVNAVAYLAYELGNALRFVQNGRLQNYLGFTLTMVLIGIIYLILK
ncbi:NADH-quinone oxidoreductase subunit 5 family protein [Sphingobacterium litopenaei]|uniref:NADH-quinone oxidoreductase subunit L n=1 Tax=Sphingobacterium litopenaei TaxID=2763500 RepID=A0ABR7YI62_9SPHI|nr:NADH-quinone oxidoreductase subunit L [Sphingobacterium litopenaei]MBD1430970.1 NADH-quinone oxidoreductase subunit L [Sphingobacterium litopenaei]